MMLPEPWVVPCCPSRRGLLQNLHCLQLSHMPCLLWGFRRLLPLARTLFLVHLLPLQLRCLHWCLVATASLFMMNGWRTG